MSPLDELAYKHMGIGKPQEGRDFVSIQSGQTLSGIASGIGVDLDTFLSWNPHINDPSNVAPGTEVYLNARTAKKAAKGKII